MLNLLANLVDLARAAADELLAHYPGGIPAVHDDVPRALCVVPGRPHAATDGRLCRDHFEELGRWLREIETEAKRVDAAPSMQSRLGQGGGGSLASHQAPVVLDAVVYGDRRTTAHGHRHLGPVCDRCPPLFARGCACPMARLHIHYPGCPVTAAHKSCLVILTDRDEWSARENRLLSVYGVLHGWAQQVRDERLMKIPTRRVIDRVPGLPRPVDNCACSTCAAARWIRHVPLPLTIATERDVLTRQLGWIAEQPWIGDMRRELGDLRAQLLRHNRNEDERPLSGYCYRLVDGQECGGSLFTAEPVHSVGPDTDAEDEGPHRPRAVVCERNPLHRWEGRDLARLSLILEQQRRADAAHWLEPAPAPAAPGPLRIVSTAGQGGRLDPLLAEQRRKDDASRPSPTSTEGSRSR